MNHAMIRPGAVSLLALCIACHGDDPLLVETGPPAKTIAGIEIVSGDGQKARVGVPLEEAFVVRVTDPEGNGIPGIAVIFRTTQDVSGLASSRVGSFTNSLRLITDDDGIAHAWLTPWRLGTGTAVVHAEHWPIAPVAFAYDADIYRMAFLADWGLCPPTFWCIEPPPIPLGTPVEWVNEDFVPHAVASVSIPEGAMPFDSGMLLPGESFRFAFDVPGVWEYHDPLAGGSSVIRTLVIEEVQ